MKQIIPNYIFCIFKNGHTIYTMSEFNVDFKSNKTTKPFLRKGQGKRMSNLKSHINYEYLKKGEGKLASDFHGQTKFSEKRKQQIIDEQFERERKFYEEQDKEDDNNSDHE